MIHIYLGRRLCIVKGLAPLAFHPGRGPRECIECGDRCSMSNPKIAGAFGDLIGLTLVFGMYQQYVGSALRRCSLARV